MSLISSFVVVPADRMDHWAYPAVQSRKCAFCLATCSAFLQQSKSSEIKCCGLSPSMVSYFEESAAWDEERPGSKC